MRITRVLRALAVGTAIYVGAAGVMAEEFTEEYRKTFPLENGAAVRVENVNGKVEVIAWDAPNAEVRAIKRTRKDRAELARVSIEVSTASGLDIRTNNRKSESGDDTFLSRMFGGVHTSPKVTVDYTIRIPRTARLERVRTVNGAIILKETRGATVAGTTNGTVTADGVDRIEDASTTNGNISITGTTVDKASTTNGSISVTVTTANPEDMSFSTVNGSVSLTLPTPVNADVELRTVNGHVSVPGGLTLKEGVISPRKISGRLGSGGRVISAETVNGSVSLQSAGSN